MVEPKEFRIGIWGGTGKSAAFINRYGIDAERFPVVVDSDINKVGTFVPGTGQEILAPSWLIDNPVEVIIIPTQWRANDIYREINETNIHFDTLLIEHEGRLIDYLKNKHPYPIVTKLRYQSDNLSIKKAGRTHD